MLLRTLGAGAGVAASTLEFGRFYDPNTHAHRCRSHPAHHAGRAEPPAPKISTLTTLAATLLVYASVLKGSVGEAFVSALVLTGKYQAKNKEVLAAYAKLYNLLQQAGSDSWEEYLMDQAGRGGTAAVEGGVHASPRDAQAHARTLTQCMQACAHRLSMCVNLRARQQTRILQICATPNAGCQACTPVLAAPPPPRPQILTARDNAFARAVAQGTLSDGAPVLKAVAYDLDVLQKLSLPMARLAQYIGEAAPVAGPYWVAAGDLLAFPVHGQKPTRSCCPCSTHRDRKAGLPHFRAHASEIAAKAAQVTACCFKAVHVYGAEPRKAVEAAARAAPVLAAPADLPALLPHREQLASRQSLRGHH